MFSKMPHIPTSDEVLNKAFSRARKVSIPIDKKRRVDSVRDKEIQRIDTSMQVVTSQLGKIIAKTPRVDELS